MYLERDDWNGDPHRHNPDVHYRLYAGTNGPTVICVQDSDYIDYDARCILSPDAWDTEGAAEQALAMLLPLTAGLAPVLAQLNDQDLQARILAISVRRTITDQTWVDLVEIPRER